MAKDNNYNFDHPDAFDFDVVLDKLKHLKMGRQVRVDLTPLLRPPSSSCH